MQIKLHLEKLRTKKKEMVDKWDQHWEWLQQSKPTWSSPPPRGRGKGGSWGMGPQDEQWWLELQLGGQQQASSCSVAASGVAHAQLARERERSVHVDKDGPCWIPGWALVSCPTSGLPAAGWAEPGGRAHPEEPFLRAVPPSLAVLEVHQFAQEAVVADAWLTAQEPLLRSRELGNSVDEVEQLIRRHEAFRKAAAAWEERFSSLRRLTTVRAQTRGHCPGGRGQDRLSVVGTQDTYWPLSCLGYPLRLRS